MLNALLNVALGLAKEAQLLRLVSRVRFQAVSLA